MLRNITKNDRSHEISVFWFVKTVRSQAGVASKINDESKAVDAKREVVTIHKAFLTPGDPEGKRTLRTLVAPHRTLLKRGSVSHRDTNANAGGGAKTRELLLFNDLLLLAKAKADRYSYKSQVCPAPSSESITLLWTSSLQSIPKAMEILPLTFFWRAMRQINLEDQLQLFPQPGFVRLVGHASATSLARQDWMLRFKSEAELQS